MSLYRKYSGLLFDDNLISTDARWNYSPTTAFIHNNVGGTVTMQHSVNNTMMLFDLPIEERDLMLEVSANYLPTADGDEGGILIWQDSVNKLEFVESMHTSVDEYKVWRAVKTGPNWKFFARRGLSDWEFFDSAPLAATMAGVILKGQGDEHVDLNLDRVVLCKGQNIRVANLQPGHQVKLLNSSGTAVRTVPSNGGAAEVQLPNVPFIGKVQLCDSLGNQIDVTDELNIYGGDVFLYGIDLKVIFEGEELSKFNETSLGALYDDFIEKQMFVLNPAPMTVNNVKVAIAQYLNKFGYEWVDVAPDEAGVAGTYGDVVSIGTLAENEQKPFWVKFQKQDNRFSTEPAKFFLDVSYGG